MMKDTVMLSQAIQYLFPEFQSEQRFQACIRIVGSLKMKGSQSLSSSKTACLVFSFKEAVGGVKWLHEVVVWASGWNKTMLAGIFVVVRSKMVCLLCWACWDVT